MAIDLGSGGTGLQSEINVTPLVDVVLVLLIIFMVILPVTMHGYDVDIPAPSDGTVVQPPSSPPELEQIVLTVDSAGCGVLLAQPQGDTLPAGCSVRLGDRAVAVDDLAAALGALVAPLPAEDRVVFLVADDRLNYEGVLRIVDVAKSADADLRVGMVMPPSSGS